MVVPDAHPASLIACDRMMPERLRGSPATAAAFPSIVVDEASHMKKNAFMSISENNAVGLGPVQTAPWPDTFPCSRFKYQQNVKPVTVIPTIHNRILWTANYGIYPLPLRRSKIYLQEYRYRQLYAEDHL